MPSELQLCTLPLPACYVLSECMFVRQHLRSEQGAVTGLP